MWARWHLNLAIFADVTTFHGEFRREFSNAFYIHNFNKKVAGSEWIWVGLMVSKYTVICYSDPLYFFFLIFLSHYSSTNPKKIFAALSPSNRSFSPSYRHGQDPPSVPQDHNMTAFPSD
ncbi:hypothetical protein Hanom_Chr06g00561461 [Helianthus anomalus]